MEAMDEEKSVQSVLHFKVFMCTCSSGPGQAAEQPWLLLLFSTELKGCYGVEHFSEKQMRKKNQNQDCEKRANENYLSICFLHLP